MPASAAKSPGSPPTLLDGGTATELQRRGIEVNAPWWSAGALRTPEGQAVLRQVHTEFIQAGAQVITANTFRTSRYSLSAAGASEADADTLTETALNLAMTARAQSGAPAGRVTVAASVPPLGDCYRPQDVPAADVLTVEHRWHVQRAARYGAELILGETVNTLREALAILAEGRRAGLPVWVSFACGPGGRLLSGEPAAAAARVAEAAGAAAVLVNCTPPAHTALALARIRDAGISVPLGAYPNFEDRSAIPAARHVNRYVEAAGTPAQYAAAMTSLAAGAGLAVVGGCCGVSPQHLAALAAVPA